MTKLTLILMAAVVAMSGASAVAKPATERLAAASASTAPLTKAEGTRLRVGLAPGDEIAPRLKKIKSSIQALKSPFATKKLQMASLSRGHAETIALDQALVKLRTGFDAVDQRFGSTGGRASVDATRAALSSLQAAIEAKMKGLQDKIKERQAELEKLNSEVQRVQTAASNVVKKLDEAKNSITQNLQ